MTPFPALPVRLAATLAAAAFAGSVHAQSVTWPAAAPPCNGTLQACIDAQPSGFQVLIDSDAPTNVVPAGNTALRIDDKSLVLAPAAGRRPLFPNGLEIVVQANAPGRDVAISGLTLRNGGRVRVFADHANGAVDVAIERMRFEHLATFGEGIEVNQNAGGLLRIRVRDNDYLRTGGPGLFAFVRATAGQINGEIAFNRVSIPDGDTSAYGLAVGASDTGSFDLTVAGNEIHGSFAFGALCAIAAPSTSLKLPLPAVRWLSNVVRPAVRGRGTGLCAFAGEAPLHAEIVNNTLIDLETAIRLVPRPFTPPASPAPITGLFANNLIAWNGTGVVQAPVAAAVTNQHNLFFGNGSNGSGFTAGILTLFANPQLTSRERPYLGPGSPAINAGNINVVPTPSIWPRLDADGLRRTIGSAPDIGAYESGDAHFGAVAGGSNLSGNYFVLDHPSTNGQSLARVFATPNPELGGTVNTGPFGVWWIIGDARMSIFNQNTAAPMAAGVGFNAFVPGAQAPVGSGPPRDANVFVHRAGSPASASTMLDDSSVNGRPGHIVLATQNWNPQDPPASIGVYNNRHVTLEIFAGERWRVVNTNGDAIPVGAAFNVYAQPPSPNAFVQPASPMVGSRIVLDHRWLNGNPCARFQVTSVFADAVGFDVDYQVPTGRWAIFRQGPGTWPPGARFHVLVSPRQVFECAGPLFRDGFE